MVDVGAVRLPAEFTFSSSRGHDDPHAHFSSSPSFAVFSSRDQMRHQNSFMRDGLESSNDINDEGTTLTDMSLMFKLSPSSGSPLKRRLRAESTSNNIINIEDNNNNNYNYKYNYENKSYAINNNNNKRFHIQEYPLDISENHLEELENQNQIKINDSFSLGSHSEPSIFGEESRYASFAKRNSRRQNGQISPGRRLSCKESEDKDAQNRPTSQSVPRVFSPTVQRKLESRNQRRHISSNEKSGSPPSGPAPQQFRLDRGMSHQQSLKSPYSSSRRVNSNNSALLYAINNSPEPNGSNDAASPTFRTDSLESILVCKPGSHYRENKRPLLPDFQIPLTAEVHLLDSALMADEPSVCTAKPSPTESDIPKKSSGWGLKVKNPFGGGSSSKKKVEPEQLTNSVVSFPEQDTPELSPTSSQLTPGTGKRTNSSRGGVPTYSSAMKAKRGKKSLHDAGTGDVTSTQISRLASGEDSGATLSYQEAAPRDLDTPRSGDPVFRPVDSHSRSVQSAVQKEGQDNLDLTLGESESVVAGSEQKKKKGRSGFSKMLFGSGKSSSKKKAALEDFDKQLAANANKSFSGDFQTDLGLDEDLSSAQYSKGASEYLTPTKSTAKSKGGKGAPSSAPSDDDSQFRSHLSLTQETSKKSSTKNFIRKLSRSSRSSAASTERSMKLPWQHSSHKPEVVSDGNPDSEYDVDLAVSNAEDFSVEQPKKKKKGFLSGWGLGKSSKSKSKKGKDNQTSKSVTNLTQSASQIDYLDDSGYPNSRMAGSTTHGSVQSAPQFGNTPSESQVSGTTETKSKKKKKMTLGSLFGLSSSSKKKSKPEPEPDIFDSKALGLTSSHEGTSVVTGEFGGPASFREAPPPKVTVTKEAIDKEAEKRLQLVRTQTKDDLMQSLRDVQRKHLLRQSKHDLWKFEKYEILKKSRKEARLNELNDAQDGGEAGRRDTEFIKEVMEREQKFLDQESRAALETSDKLQVLSKTGELRDLKRLDWVIADAQAQVDAMKVAYAINKTADIVDKLFDDSELSKVLNEKVTSLENQIEGWVRDGYLNMPPGVNMSAADFEKIGVLRTNKVILEHLNYLINVAAKTTADSYYKDMVDLSSEIQHLRSSIENSINNAFAYFVQMLHSRNSPEIPSDPYMMSFTAPSNITTEYFLLPPFLADKLRLCTIPDVAGSSRTTLPESQATSLTERAEFMLRRMTRPVKLPTGEGFAMISSRTDFESAETMLAGKFGSYKLFEKWLHDAMYWQWQDMMIQQQYNKDTIGLQNLMAEKRKYVIAAVETKLTQLWTGRSLIIKQKNVDMLLKYFMESIHHRPPTLIAPNQSEIECARMEAEDMRAGVHRFFAGPLGREIIRIGPEFLQGKPPILNAKPVKDLQQVQLMSDMIGDLKKALDKDATILDDLEMQAVLEGLEKRAKATWKTVNEYQTERETTTAKRLKRKKSLEKKLETALHDLDEEVKKQQEAAAAEMTVEEKQELVANRQAELAELKKTSEETKKKIHDNKHKLKDLDKELHALEKLAAKEMKSLKESQEKSDTYQTEYDMKKERSEQLKTALGGDTSSIVVSSHQKKSGWNMLNPFATASKKTLVNIPHEPPSLSAPSAQIPPSVHDYEAELMLPQSSLLADAAGTTPSQSAEYSVPTASAPPSGPPLHSILRGTSGRSESRAVSTAGASDSEHEQPEKKSKSRSRYLKMSFLRRRHRSKDDAKGGGSDEESRSVLSGRSGSLKDSSIFRRGRSRSRSRDETHRQPSKNGTVPVRRYSSVTGIGAPDQHLTVTKEDMRRAGSFSRSASVDAGKDMFDNYVGGFDMPSPAESMRRAESLSRKEEAADMMLTQTQAPTSLPVRREQPAEGSGTRGRRVPVEPTSSFEEGKPRQSITRMSDSGVPRDDTGSYNSDVASGLTTVTVQDSRKSSSLWKKMMGRGTKKERKPEYTTPEPSTSLPPRKSSSMVHASSQSKPGMEPSGSAAFSVDTEKDKKKEKHHGKPLFGSLFGKSKKEKDSAYHGVADQATARSAAVPQREIGSYQEPPVRASSQVPDVSRMLLTEGSSFHEQPVPAPSKKMKSKLKEYYEEYEESPAEHKGPSVSVEYPESVVARQEGGVETRKEDRREKEQPRVKKGHESPSLESWPESDKELIISSEEERRPMRSPRRSLDDHIEPKKEQVKRDEPEEKQKKKPDESVVTDGVLDLEAMLADSLEYPSPKDKKTEDKKTEDKKTEDKKHVSEHIRDMKMMSSDSEGDELGSQVAVRKEEPKKEEPRKFTPSKSLSLGQSSSKSSKQEFTDNNNNNILSPRSSDDSQERQKGRIDLELPASETRLTPPSSDREMSNRNMFVEQQKKSVSFSQNDDLPSPDSSLSSASAGAVEVLFRTAEGNLTDHRHVDKERRDHERRPSRSPSSSFESEEEIRSPIKKQKEEIEQLVESEAEDLSRLSPVIEASSEGGSGHRGKHAQPHTLVESPRDDDETDEDSPKRRSSLDSQPRVHSRPRRSSLAEGLEEDTRSQKGLGADQSDELVLKVSGPKGAKNVDEGSVVVARYQKKSDSELSGESNSDDQTPITKTQKKKSVDIGIQDEKKIYKEQLERDSESETETKRVEKKKSEREMSPNSSDSSEYNKNKRSIKQSSPKEEDEDDVRKAAEGHSSLASSPHDRSGATPLRDDTLRDELDVEHETGDKAVLEDEYSQYRVAPSNTEVSGRRLSSEDLTVVTVGGTKSHKKSAAGALWSGVANLGGKKKPKSTKDGLKRTETVKSEGEGEKKAKKSGMTWNFGGGGKKDKSKDKDKDKDKVKVKDKVKDKDKLKVQEDEQEKEQEREKEEVSNDQKKRKQSRSSQSAEESSASPRNNKLDITSDRSPVESSPPIAQSRSSASLTDRSNIVPAKEVDEIIDDPNKQPSGYVLTAHRRNTPRSIFYREPAVSSPLGSSDSSRRDRNTETPTIRDVLATSELTCLMNDEEKQMTELAVERVTVKEGTVLFEPGEPVDVLYGIEQGRVTISSKKGEFIEDLNPGDFVFDLAFSGNTINLPSGLLLSPTAHQSVHVPRYKTKAMARAVAGSKCIMWKLPRESFESLMTKCKNRVRERATACVKQIPNLNMLTWSEAAELARRGVLQYGVRDDVIAKENSPGDALYIVVQGVAVSVNPTDERLEQYHAWDVFGCSTFGGDERTEERLIAQTVPTIVLKISERDVVAVSGSKVKDLMKRVPKESVTQTDSLMDNNMDSVSVVAASQHDKKKKKGFAQSIGKMLGGGGKSSKNKSGKENQTSKRESRDLDAEKKETKKKSSKDKRDKSSKDKPSSPKKQDRLESPKESPMRSPKESSVRSPKDSSIRSPKDSSIRSPKDSSIRSPKDSSIRSPKDSLDPSSPSMSPLSSPQSPKELRSRQMSSNIVPSDVINAPSLSSEKFRAQNKKVSRSYSDDQDENLTRRKLSLMDDKYEEQADEDEEEEIKNIKNIKIEPSPRSIVSSNSQYDDEMEYEDSEYEE